MLLLCCFCLFWGAQWVDKNYGRLLCGRWHLQQLVPSCLLEDTCWCGTPVVWEKVSKRTVGCLASLVTERWSSPPRPRDRVRASGLATTPMIPSRGWNLESRALLLATGVAQASCGLEDLHALLPVCLHIACIACDVIKAPVGTSKWRRGVTFSKLVVITKVTPFQNV